MFQILILWPIEEAKSYIVRMVICFLRPIED